MHVCVCVCVYCGAFIGVILYSFLSFFFFFLGGGGLGVVIFNVIKN